MRLRIQHETAYRYDTPVNWVIQTLRLTPRGHDTQHVVGWRIDVDHDVRLQQTADAFGNLVHSFTIGGTDHLTITAIGEVETEDGSGVVAGQRERFPPILYLRDTELTHADPALRALAETVRPADGDTLGALHRLMSAVAERMKFDIGSTDAGTSAATALESGHGVCQDFAHIFIAAARQLGIPARYVSGYLYRPDTPDGQDAGHGWAEAHVDGLGWIGFDPTNAICPTEAYVRLSVGLDYLGAAPVRGSRYGGGGETLAVRVRVEPVARPAPRPRPRGQAEPPEAAPQPRSQDPGPAGADEP